MRIFVAGATGAVGSRLVPRLLERGHAVIAMTRTPQKFEALHASGATPVLADALDQPEVRAAVLAAQPEVVVSELTSLSSLGSNLRRFDSDFAVTNRLRIEGTDHLLEAARAAQARLFVTQSYAGWTYARVGGAVKREDDPLDSDPPASARQTLRALQTMESRVLGGDGPAGVVLRYGAFYGPGTSLGRNPPGAHLTAVARGRFPIVGDGGGVWSFIHVEDAAEATALAVERAASGIYNVVDDEPAFVADWLPVLASSIGAKPPRRVPAWLTRLLAGDLAVVMMTATRGASNRKAKDAFDWRLRYPTWREGFAQGLG
ncbi:MAG: NAD-dependent epimerase/dehydratase family protein [Candidatus Dormibacteria bacterium]